MIEKPDEAEVIEKAIEWVVTRMKGLRRKSGDRPMVTHSLRVGFTLDRAGESVKVVAAGILHDLTEDASVTSNEIELEFGKEIRLLVDACSHDNRLHEEDRKKSNLDLFKRAIAHGRDAIIIKVADASDNIQGIQYLKEDRQTEFIERAKLWKTAGEQFCGPQHSLVAQLSRRIERASAIVLEV